jgi:hypothetical protein
MKLRELEVFKEGFFGWSPDGNMKRINIAHSSNDLTIIGNFGVTNATIDPAFQSTGTWYDYFTGITIEVVNPNEDFLLAPGQFHIFSREPLPATEPDLVPFRPDAVTALPNTGFAPFQYYPNPTKGWLKVIFDELSFDERTVSLIDNLGKEVLNMEASGISEIELDVSDVPQGLYFLQVKEGQSIKHKKILIGR